MNMPSDLSTPWIIVTAVLLVAGSVLTFIGSLGLLRLQTFYQRIHAPTLGTTLGTFCTATASLIYFTVSGSRVALHEVLIVIFITMTMPVSLMVLVRAARLRDRFEKNENALGEAGPASEKLDP